MATTMSDPIPLESLLRELRFEFRDTADVGAIPTWLMVDRLLDYGNRSWSHAVVSNYVLYKVHRQIKARRSEVTWTEIDAAIEELEP